MPKFQSDATPEPAPEPVPEPAPEPEAVEADPPEEPTPEVEAEATTSFETLDDAIAEVKKLREENARRRISNKELSEVFDQFGPEERQAMLALASKVATNPLDAEEQLTTILNRVRELKGLPPEETAVEEPETEEAPAAEEEAEQKFLTQEDVDRILEERMAAAEEEREIKAFIQQAADLGYEKDTAEYGMLLHYAAEADLKGNADPIAAGHARFQERDQKIADEAIEEYKRSVAEGRPMTKNTATSVSPPSPSDPAEKVDGDLKDWNVARRRGQARLRGAAAGESNSSLV